MRRSSIITVLMALLTAALVMSVSGSLQAAVYKNVEPIEITDDARDSSVELVGYLFIPRESQFSKPPLVILLHDNAESHIDWNDYAEYLTSKGFAALGMDLRGHGLSIYDLRKHHNRPKRTFYPGDFEKFPGDVLQLVNKTIKTQGSKFDTTRLAVIGAALGANTGLLYAVDDPRVKYTALISPGLELMGLNIADALPNYGTRPLFIAVSEKDIYSMESCNLLSDLSPRVLDMQVYDGYFHGTRLVDQNLDLQRKLVDDLNKYMR
jgi:pimeloyl-ACP methyl ester carboxylesterase